MASFDKVLFVQAMETEVLSVKDITERFNVSTNTARAWVKHSSIKAVEGYYPYRYTAKSNTTADDSAPIVTGVDHSKCVKLHEVTTEQLDGAISGSLASKTTVGEILSSITNAKELEQVEARLISLIQIARRYYEKDVKD